MPRDNSSAVVGDVLIAREAPPASDAYRTTGTSPTRRGRRSHDGFAVVPKAATPPELRLRGYDRVHIVGPGAVGRALLERFHGDRRRVVAVTDSTATLHAPAGIDVRAIAEWKRDGRPLAEHPDALQISSAAALALVDADVIADTSATVLGRPDWTAALGAALARGACVATAAKASLCDAGAEWLTGEHRTRVGCNAVLGGTGRSFSRELAELRQRTRAIAIAGNASTTAILQAVERGGTLAAGIAEAGRLGFLEPDPELDLRGTDAAVKLAIVAGIVTGRRIDPLSIECDDIRNLDLLTVRARTRRNATTRLVARLGVGGGLRVAYEEVARDSMLAAPCGRVVYEYHLTRDERRIHIGSGLGAEATAGAVWSDIRALAAEAVTSPPACRAALATTSARSARAEPATTPDAVRAEVAR